MSCERQFTMTEAAGSGPDFSAYWAMEEASGDRVDSVGNVENNLILIGPETGNTTGRVGNGLPSSKLGTRFVTIGSSLVFNESNEGMAFAFWFNQASGSGSWVRFYLIAWELVFMIDVRSNLVYAELQGLTINSLAQINAPGSQWNVGDWHFVVANFPTSTRKTKICIDGGAWVESADAADIAGAETSGPNMEGPDYIGGGPLQSLVLDEIGFVQDKIITDDQVAYLYNSGNGRTWPINP